MDHRIIQGDCIEGLRTLPDGSVHCCVTSPPYWGLRDYGHDGQIGLEDTPEAYVARMVEVFREVRRVLRDDGTLWLNLGDSYANKKSGDTYSGFNDRYFGRETDGGKQAKTVSTANVGRLAFPGLKPKDLVGIPWRVAFALQADGWWLRQDIIWAKPNPMPESVRDRCTKAHEYVFLLTKSERYYYDAEAVSEAAATAGQKGLGFYPGRAGAMGRKPSGNEAKDPSEGTRPAVRNRRSVWTVTTKPYSGAHFAVIPAALVEPCIKAGCPEQCCPGCGKGWERITKRVGEYTTQWGSNVNLEKQSSYPNVMSKTNQSRKEKMMVGVHETLGWQPACDCAASGTIPGTVLDPFAGSGTTLAVAAELGRSGIGCELNPEYIELANQRIAKSKAKMPLFVA
jgi:DNA modification methylase